MICQDTIGCEKNSPIMWVLIDCEKDNNLLYNLAHKDSVATTKFVIQGWLSISQDIVVAGLVDESLMYTVYIIHPTSFRFCPGPPYLVFS